MKGKTTHRYLLQARQPCFPHKSFHRQVVGWAQQEFVRETGPHKQDGRINLARACLLIALEEVSSVEMHPELESTLRDMEIK